MLHNSGPSIEPLGNPDRISYREPYISDILVPRLQYVRDHKRASWPYFQNNIRSNYIIIIIIMIIIMIMIIIIIIVILVIIIFQTISYAQNTRPWSTLSFPFKTLKSVTFRKSSHWQLLFLYYTNLIIIRYE